MSYVKHPDRTQLHKYVLHARHGLENQTTLRSVIGENFQKKLEDASTAFKQIIN
jgi:hypothetical protein